MINLVFEYQSDQIYSITDWRGAIPAKGDRVFLWMTLNNIRVALYYYEVNLVGWTFRNRKNGDDCAEVLIVLVNQTGPL